MKRQFTPRLALLLALLLTASARAEMPRELVVGPAGSDSGDGTAARPLKTLAKALALAESGDTIRLLPGTHRGRAKTRLPGVTIVGPREAVLVSPGERGLEIRHDRTTLRGFTLENCDIGIWIEGASDCLLEDLLLRDLDGEGLRIKNQSCRNVVRRCRFERMGRTGFDVVAGRKNGEGVYIGTAPEQRAKNGPPIIPDHCTGNRIEDCTFKTEAAEAVDIKEDSEENVVLRCVGEDSRDPDGAIFGSRGDRNRFEQCVARGGRGHGFRFGGDTVQQGKYGQPADRTYGKHNVMRQCWAEDNALYGAAPMVQPQDIDASNIFAGNVRGAIRK